MIDPSTGFMDSIRQDVSVPVSQDIHSVIPLSESLNISLLDMEQRARLQQFPHPRTRFDWQPGDLDQI
ncbi:MAG: hypothetical protein QGF78_05165 [Candidatus Bathyarchaeota archaeon]|nr:hypothetical protein [Candidatus Bathyarchaeota archaeon]